MRHPRRGLLPAVALCTLCLAQAGCLSALSRRAAPDARAQAVGPAIRPGTMLDWTVTGPGQPQGGTTGHSVVGVDGKMEMGPFGSVPVQGLTLARAQPAVERQLRHYLRDPKVELRLAQPRPQPAPAPAAAVAQAPPADIARWSSDDDENLAAARGGLPPRAAAVRLVSTQQGPFVDGPALVIGGTSEDKGVLKSPGNGKDGSTKKATEELGPPRPLPGHPAGPVVPGPDAVGPGCAGPDCGGPGGPFPGPGGPVPRECARVTLPPYVVGPPDILLIETVLGTGLVTQKVEGQHLVRPDGTVGLGIYGSIYVAGRTLDQIRWQVSEAIYARLDPKAKTARDPKERLTLKKVYDNVSVDVLAYNSKVYYVITDGGGLGDQVTRLPITGNETVLDAIGLNPTRLGLYGLGPISDKHHIWVARPNCHGHEEILPVDWIGITQRGDPATNYQVQPGDRVYVKADHFRTLNNNLDKFVTPIERILGVTLLGSQTVNSIRAGSTSVP
jgi:polysaccharide export outer membrane protein